MLRDYASIVTDIKLHLSNEYSISMASLSLIFSIAYPGIFNGVKNFMKTSFFNVASYFCFAALFSCKLP